MAAALVRMPVSILAGLDDAVDLEVDGDVKVRGVDVEASAEACADS